jgi:hypothetical protein
MVDQLMNIFGPEHFPASAAIRRTPARAEEEFWKTLLWLPVNFIQAVSLASERVSPTHSHIVFPAF